MYVNHMVMLGEWWELNSCPTVPVADKHRNRMIPQPFRSPEKQLHLLETAPK